MQNWIRLTQGPAINLSNVEVITFHRDSSGELTQVCVLTNSGRTMTLEGHMAHMVHKWVVSNCKVVNSLEGIE